MYIPLPFEKLSEKQQIERHSAQFQKELRKLPLTRPLFVLCGYRIPPPTAAAHSWAFVIDGDNVMYFMTQAAKTRITQHLSLFEEAYLPP